jgi:hypothetical protein|tara:strand:+ start:3486 stop:3911 length:426 start_codon:yes stop_codon:yes gene_type:complete
MHYLNEVTQFTRVSDVQAKSLMETLGYSIPSAVAHHVYAHDDSRFTLSEEVVEGDDECLYVRLGEITHQTVIHVDENGAESMVESVSFDEIHYDLEGLYEDDEGTFFARLVQEGVSDDEEEEEDVDSDEDDEEAVEEETAE